MAVIPVVMSSWKNRILSLLMEFQSWILFLGVRTALLSVVLIRLPGFCLLYTSYLAQSSSRHYVLKPFCDTQRKIEALFADKADPVSLRIKNGLFTIANEVLFLRDPRAVSYTHLDVYKRQPLFPILERS